MCIGIKYGNFIRNKFDELLRGVKRYKDILMMSETKLDNRFPTRQFLIDGYTSLYGSDRNGKSGGIIVCVLEYMPSNIILVHYPVKRVFS